MSDDNLTDRMRDVFAKFGLAMCYAQRTERGAAILLAARATPHGASQDSFSARAAQCVELTFGQLVAQLAPYLNHEAELRAELERLHPLRDRLAHQFFMENEVEIHTSAGLSKMGRELDGYIEAFLKTQEKLLTLLEEFLKGRGGTEEEISRRMAEALREGSGPPGPPPALPRRVVLTGVSLYVPRRDTPEDHYPVFTTEAHGLLVIGDHGLCPSTASLDQANFHPLPLWPNAFPAEVVVRPKGARDHNFEIPLRSGHKLIAETDASGASGFRIVPPGGGESRARKKARRS